METFGYINPFEKNTNFQFIFYNLVIRDFSVSPTTLFNVVVTANQEVRVV